MAKFRGIIGFSETKEKEPGIWEPEISEKTYSGDSLRRSYRNQNSSGINDDINISNEISIVADPYAMENFFAIQYVIFQGAKWKVTNVEVQRPRLTLTLGGVYNG